MKKFLAVILCFVIMVPVMAVFASAVTAPNAIVQGGLEGDGEVDGRDDDTEDDDTDTDTSGVAGDGNVWEFFVNLLGQADWSSILATLVSTFSTIIKIFTALGGTTTTSAIA